MPRGKPGEKWKPTPEELRAILAAHKEWLRSVGEEPRRGERAELSLADLNEMDLTPYDFVEANLSGAELIGSKLFKVRLNRANLTGAVLFAADLVEADLSSADLTGADLGQAKLSGAFLNHANLSGAYLSHANLSGADLRWANLSGTDFEYANLERADLRGVNGLRLNDTAIRDAVFTPVVARWRALAVPNDPWSVLRQFYAGPRSVFLILSLILFALPYVGRAILYSAVSAGEQRMIDTVKHYHGLRDAHWAVAGPGVESLLPAFAGQEQFVRGHTKPYPLWQILLKWDRPSWWPTILAVLLVIYNAGMYILVTWVGPLRDEEARSGRSPRWDAYRKLRWVHRTVTALYYVSMFSFLWNVWELLSETVWVPVR